MTRRVISVAAATLVLVALFATQLHHRRPASPAPLPLDLNKSWTPVASYADVSGFATHLTAAELLARPLRVNATGIPRLFHQSWQSLLLPPKFEKWSNTCRKAHADWEWVLWTDADNLALVQKHFPWLEQTYCELPTEIYRADLARYLYMYIYGGVYADLDTDCLQPTENLQAQYGPLFDASDSHSTLTQATALFGRMGTIPDWEHAIPNAWMASTPGHPFFLDFLQYFGEHVKDEKRKWWRKMIDAEHITGPAALREGLLRYEAHKIRFGNALGADVSALAQQGPFAEHGERDHSERDHSVILLPSRYIYPYSWHSEHEHLQPVCWVLSDTFDADMCKSQVDVIGLESISITYWSHTHAPNGQDVGNTKHLENST